MLCTAAGDLCHELQTVLASVLRKPDSEMGEFNIQLSVTSAKPCFTVVEIHYWRSIAFGKAWRDRDQEEQRVRADAQGIVLASGIDAKFTDSDTPRDLSRTDSASSS